MKEKTIHYFLKTKTYAISHKKISAAVLIVIALISFYTYKKVSANSSSTQYVYGRVRKGDLSISVSGTGQVSTLSQVDIKPQTTGQAQSLGQIVLVKVQNGDFVKTGDIIAILDGKNALQVLNQAKASVATAQANFNKLVNGPVNADLALLNNTVESAQNSFENAKQNTVVKLHNAFSAAEKAIYLDTDPFFSSIETTPYLSISNVYFTNSQLQYQVADERSKIRTLFAEWKISVKNINTESDLASEIKNTTQKLYEISNYLDNLSLLFASYSTALNTSAQTAVNTDKSTSWSAKTSIDSSISDLTSALQTLNNARISFEQTTNTFALKTAAPAADDVTVVQAQLDNAKANYANASQNYESRIIRAPFDGQVGGLNAQVGMQISSNDSLGKIITQDKVVNISLNEVDAAKIAINNLVTLTFDASPDLALAGKIQYIDPLGTVTQGVVNYNVRISINEKNDAIKAGMTASADIMTEVHANTLIVPSSAIKTIANRKYVMVSTFGEMRNFASSTFGFSSSTKDFENATSGRKFSSSSKRIGRDVFSTTTISEKDLMQVEVVVGISNGMDTEILSGLTPGQTIVVKSTNTASKTTTASTANTNPFRNVSGGTSVNRALR